MRKEEEGGRVSHSNDIDDPRMYLHIIFKRSYTIIQYPFTGVFSNVPIANSKLRRNFEKLITTSFKNEKTTSYLPVHTTRTLR